MVWHYSDDVLRVDDPNGGKFGDWIVKRDLFNVTCKLCRSNVCLKEGEKALSKHSGTAKHCKAHAAQAAMGNIRQAFVDQGSRQAKNKTIEEQARDAEMIYLHHVECHGIAPHAAGCAADLFQHMFL